MSSKRAALDLAPAAIAPRFDGKAPGQIHLRSARFHRAASQERLVDQPYLKSVGEKPQWSGPFATIETACLSIGRRLAIEIADRHTLSIERHGLTPDDLLYGLKPTTRLDAP